MQRLCGGGAGPPVRGTHCCSAAVLAKPTVVTTPRLYSQSVIQAVLLAVKHRHSVFFWPFPITVSQCQALELYGISLPLVSHHHFLFKVPFKGFPFPFRSHFRSFTVLASWRRPSQPCEPSPCWPAGQADKLSLYRQFWTHLRVWRDFANMPPLRRCLHWPGYD